MWMLRDVAQSVRRESGPAQPCEALPALSVTPSNPLKTRLPQSVARL